MRGEVSPQLLRAVYEHAASAYPRECCGLLLGPRGAPPDEARPCVNASDDAGRAFRLSADDLLALAASLDGPRPARVLYHSHVEAPACLSPEDEREALLGGDRPAWPLLHLVIEVRAGIARGARLHEWDPVQARFREIGRHETGAGAAPAL